MSLSDHNGTAIARDSHGFNGGHRESAKEYADWKVKHGYAWVKSLKFQREVRTSPSPCPVHYW